MAKEIRIGKFRWAGALRGQLVAENLPYTLFTAALMGLLGALATVVFASCFPGYRWCWAEDTPHGMVHLARGLESWQRLLLPAAGGALAGLVLQLASRWLPRRARPITWKPSPSGAGDRLSPDRGAQRVLAVSIGSGASIGREGPMVQLAAMLSSLSGRFLVLPPRQLRLLVACGATAGITAAYAPIAGALFISEIVYGVISSATLVPLVVASVVANIVTRQILHYDAVFHMPPFDFVSGWEVASYLGLGLLAGLLAPQFLRLLDLSRAGFGRLPAPCGPAWPWAA